MEIYKVRVEWMDREIREYTVGGYARYPVEEENGVLRLNIGNSQYGTPEMVARIPLCNVREYKRMERP